MMNPYAFNVDDAATYTGQSVWAIREAIRKGDLTPSYKGTKVTIKREELEAWVDSFPAEKAA
ncbi:helix-turn-helix domain-containing protein [uncultured Stenotrophomonas sp.]|uniref:helix-turn-helix domain-containing protein n=1 Tax=uncultured Stenotrophomonas sp. TaxID=165438 RepID=UPI0025D83E3D|nr:helix-turn-helix domain-containing protein [uncultured Stenotrophomonas sp.]